MFGASAATITEGEPTTPAGIQPVRTLRRRRTVVVALNLATYAGFLIWLATILDADGWRLLDVLILLAFAVAAPWSVLGFWNAAIGLWLLHGTKDPMQRAAPFAKAADACEAVQSCVAIVMTLRNEDPARAFARLETIKRGLDETGEGDRFSYFVLSDSDSAAVAAAEEIAFAHWKTASGRGEGRLFYRRRTVNTGFKAGNLRDFCERWGDAHEFMVPLDADSLMSAETILRLVRIAQTYPKLGILQSLVVGAPAHSAFARIFQFGMRHGMRTYTIGSAYWAADYGPFWGHNALVRIAPFHAHCELPVLPGKPPFGGAILSHDQVEAVLMRRAGYEVRALPEECGSYEDNPPTVLEFTWRDLRWCQGNMQYFRLVGMKGIAPMSRFQLFWAILMFIGVPAWTALIALIALAPFGRAPGVALPTTSATLLYLVFLVAFLAPKLAGFADILMTPGGAKRYGGRMRFVQGALAELIFSFLLGAMTTFRTSVFMIGLLFGRVTIWNGQARDAHSLSVVTAWRGLWPQTLFGAAVAAAGLAGSPSLLVWSLPLTLGYVLAVPFAVVTASPPFGAALMRRGLCAIPEEIERPDVIMTLDQEIGKAAPSGHPPGEASRVFEPA
ncbi:MAG TPA: glucans biosynthesis glucosyltransferase MdoH [Beijerinckiaceae bacterium]|nr:glucans biosynthesis glucosyltransferase MdoH [Beijerinckiaceae bacterium]